MINIVDLGARGGLNFDVERFTSEFRVFAIELDPEECSRLNEIEKGKQTSRTHYFPVALSSKNESRNFYLTKDPACSSMYPPIEYLAKRYRELECIDPTSIITIECVTLDSWATSNCIDYIDYLKLDTQGSELDILIGSIQTLSRTSLVEIEVEFSPIYEGQPLFADVDTFMRANGFALWNLGNLVHYSISDNTELKSNLTTFHNSKKLDMPNSGGQLYWGHALYVSQYFLGESTQCKSQNRLNELIEVANVLGLHDLSDEITLG
jgi:FkbM family methyltransferase